MVYTFCNHVVLWYPEKAEPRRELDKEFPELFIHSYQMDLLGPCRLKGHGRFYSVIIIDICSRSCSVEPIRSKATADIARFIGAFWASHSTPDALQMGSRHSRMAQKQALAIA